MLTRSKESGRATEIGDVLPNESLMKFLAALKQFERKFCDSLVSGTQFSLQLEVRGDQGVVIHIKNRVEDLTHVESPPTACPK